MAVEEGKKEPGWNVSPAEIRIDKEGTWYFHGAEMYRRDIVNLFYQNLTLDDQGRYIIEMDRERCYLEVEDTPFVVKSVQRVDLEGSGKEAIVILLVDDSAEKLDPETLHVGRDNVLYCLVRDGRFRARFNRASYYQIAAYFDYDEEGHRYYLALNGKKYDISGPVTGNPEEGD